MAVSKYNYKSDAGNFFLAVTEDDSVWQPVRGQAPTSPLTESLTGKVSKNRREFGFKPRYATYSRSVGSIGQDEENSCNSDSAVAYKFVVVLTPEHASTLRANAPDVQYKNQTYKFERITEELFV